MKPPGPAPHHIGRARTLLRLLRDVPLSALAVATLLAAVWLPFQLRGYELLRRRVDTDGTGLARSSDFRVACHYHSFTGRETFVRVYPTAVPRDAYACPRLRKRGDEPSVLVFDE